MITGGPVFPPCQTSGREYQAEKAELFKAILGPIPFPHFAEILHVVPNAFELDDLSSEYEVSEPGDDATVESDYSYVNTEGGGLAAVRARHRFLSIEVVSFCPLTLTSGY